MGDNQLFLTVDEYPKILLRLPAAIPTADYRPCISLLNRTTHVRVLLSTPGRKRKAMDESAQPHKIARRLWSSKDFSDSRIVCGNRTFHVHRCVLSAASPFFERAFGSSMQEGSNACITFDDCGHAEVELLL